MKKFFILFTCIGALGCSTFNSSNEKAETAPAVRKTVRDVPFKARGGEAPRNRVMVLPFLDSSESRPVALRDQARRELITELNKRGDIIVLDSNELKTDFSKLVVNGDYKTDDVAKQAQQMGVAVLMEGKIMDLKVRNKSDEVGVFRQMKTTFESSARVRLIAARSGKEIMNTVKTVTIEESNIRVAETVDKDRFFKNNPELVQRLIEDTFLEFADQIVASSDKLSWEGRIALISGDRVFLNVGRVSGLQMGDILKVSDDGDEVYDPQSGNYIGKGPGRLKGTLEVVSYFGQDGAIAVIHSGAGFKENDKVELY